MNSIHSGEVWTAQQASPRSASPGNSLAGLLVRRVPTAGAGQTVGEAWSVILGTGWDVVDILVLVDESGRLAGVVDARDLWAADPSELVAALKREWPTVGVDIAPERAALTAHRDNVPALPVLDQQGVLLGCLRSEILLDILWQEHADDLHRFAGIQRETLGARRAFLSDSPLRRVRKRLPWLIVGAIGSAMATSIMAQFEAALTANVTIAFFVPAIVYLADAVGTQTEAIAVRGLTLEHHQFGHALLRETATGLLIGLFLCVFAMFGVILAFGVVKLALVVGLALLAASSFASVFGVALPWLLDHLGFDPAFGAGPLATIIQDLASISLYLALVTWLLL